MAVYNYPLLIRDQTFIRNQYGFMIYSDYHEWWYDVNDFLKPIRYDFNLIYNV